MSSRQSINRRPRAGQIVLLLASLVVLIAGLKVAQGFFVPVLLAFFIATVSFPITNWLRNHRFPRSLAVLVTVLVDFAFLVGVVVLAIVIISDVQEEWDRTYYDRTKEVLEDASASMTTKLKSWGMESEFFNEVSEDLAATLETTGAKIDEEIAPGAVGESLGRPAAELGGGWSINMNQWSKIWDFGTDVVGRVVSFFATSLIVIILTVFMLTEARMFGRRFDAICEARGPNIQRMMSALRDTQRYLGIKTVISLVTGTLAGLLCWAAGLDFPLLWGILAYALNYIPVVGSFIAGVPPTMLALIQEDMGPPEAVAVAGGFFLINTFLGNFIEPMLMGRRFGISTLVVMMSVMFWGWLWGPIGMLLAVPLTMMLKVVLDNSLEFRWIAVAIGKESERPAEEARIISEGAAERPEDEEEEGPMGETAEAAGRS